MKIFRHDRNCQIGLLTEITIWCSDNKVKGTQIWVQFDLHLHQKTNWRFGLMKKSNHQEHTLYDYRLKLSLKKKSQI